MKSVLLSIKPKYCELIASGEKTVEIRKNRPKIEPPFKVYIYCTKGKYKLLEVVHKGEDFYGWKPEKTEFIKTPDLDIKFWHWRGKVIGEFVCDRIDKYEAEFTEDNESYQDIRLIWKDTDYDCEAEEDYLIVTSNERDNPNDCILCKESCLSFEEIKQYIGICFGENGYAWHISDLIIYDKPKDLDEFEKPCSHNCKNCKYWYSGSPIDYEPPCCEWEDCVIIRPPQSWCYVEGLEDLK